jgi:hypothetical protein
MHMSYRLAASHTILPLHCAVDWLQLAGALGLLMIFHVWVCGPLWFYHMFIVFPFSRNSAGTYVLVTCRGVNEWNHGHVHPRRKANIKEFYGKIS